MEVSLAVGCGAHRKHLLCLLEAAQARYRLLAQHVGRYQVLWLCHRLYEDVAHLLQHGAAAGVECVVMCCNAARDLLRQSRQQAGMQWSTLR